jgi:hypothetical protein
VGLNSPKTIAEVLDEIERIQQELFSLQKAVEKIEKADIASRGDKRKKKKVIVSRHGPK